MHGDIPSARSKADCERPANPPGSSGHEHGAAMWPVVIKR
jgi:hypothetical protein